MKFKTVGGESDRCSGILFNVKPNGDWLAMRYNDTENNVALWEFHNGIRRNVKFSDRSKPFMLDRNAWHELKMTVNGADFKAWLDGAPALEYTLGSEPAAGKKRTAQCRLDSRQQSGVASARSRQSRPLVEDGQHQLLQGLCSEPAAIRLVAMGSH